MKRLYAALLILFLLSQCAYAIPTIQAAVAVNQSSVTFRATNVANPPAYFKYGTVSGNYAWVTDNSSNITGGNELFLKEMGTPLMSSTTFYYRCCDASGCSAGEQSSTLTAVTPAPTTTFGVVARNISRSHFDVAELGGNIIAPTLWTLPNAEVLFGIVLFFLFTGIWIRHREIVMPVILGLIGSSLLIYSGTNSVGLPPEFLIIVVGIVAAGLTGVLLGIMKK